MRFITACCLLFFIALMLMELVGLRINTTPSIPVTVYILDTDSIPKKGDIVSVCPPDDSLQQLAKERGYLALSFRCPNQYPPLLKPLVAVAGDYVSIDQAISINGVPVDASTRLLVDSDGRAMPDKAKFGIVPKGKVWLLSSYNPRSWDSRYYGSLPAKNIQGVVRPLF